MTIRLWKGARVSFVFGFSVTCAREEHFKRTSRRGSQGFQYMVKGSVFLGLGGLTPWQRACWSREAGEK